MIAECLADLWIICLGCVIERADLVKAFTVQIDRCVFSSELGGASAGESF
jgi:hypothetical protein